ncbi:type II CAAX endopeptidase family protein [Algoriphagus sp. SE2]|uniref:CPBP family intramembrane glutamic endopeptidase n=1 Tax=Algoriphagus sp. SE2 TaxID=3141536 RepID=UPI0031CD4131
MSFFRNKDDNRLKSGWRICLFLILFWVFAATIFVVKPLLGDLTKREFLQGYSLLIVSILAIGATISVRIARKYFDKKSWISLGLVVSKKTYQDLLFGFALSGLMAGIFFVLLLLFDLISFQGINFSNQFFGSGYSYLEFMKVMSLGTLLLLLTEHILVGYWEELVFRGYILQNLMEGLGRYLAVLVSCLIYGLIHMANPNAGILSSAIIVFFGYLRIYGYLSTKMLWLSMGMHIGWNFFQGPIFGFAASGHRHATLLEISIISEKTWLTGGEFGPEGSVLILPILLFALMIMKAYSKR